MKDYRVLNIYDTEMEITNQHIAVIELAEVEYLNFGSSGLDTQKYTFSNTGKIIVIEFDSLLAKRIIYLAKREEIVKLSLSNFKFREEFKNGELQEIGYHNSVKLIGFENDKLITSKKLENIIEECVLYHHTDMFFNFIFLYVIGKEISENENIDDISQLDFIFDIYKKVCKYVLLESAKVITFDCEDIFDYEKSQFDIKYYKLVNHAKDYCEVINTYAIYLDEEELEYIKWELKDKSPFFLKFQQACLLKGYEISLKRIENNLENTNFFNHEIVKTENFEVLKFFPTPYGLGRKWELIEYVKDSSLLSRIENYFISYDYELIRDESILKKYGTRFVLRSLENGNIYYFKRRLRNGSYVEFAEQNRKNPFKALLVQGQLNFTKE